jgi:tetratricopeptide (TPR) repeat protein
MENTFSQWLESHELSKYIEVLLGNDIDSIELAKTLTVDDLKELGVSLGDRKRFVIAIDKLASQSHDLSDADLSLVNFLPYVIAYPLKQTLLEKHAWTRINLLKDTFLNYLKYLGLITASEFFNSPFRDKKMVTLFYNTLSEPSFGSWNVFIREALKFLNENNHQFFCPELNTYYEQVETGKKRKLYKGEIEYIDAYGDVEHKNQEATAIGIMINFRNRYLGHGLTLDEATSVKLWELYYPIFNQLLNEMAFTSDYLMYKYEHGETYRLQSAEISHGEAVSASNSNVWLQNKAGNILEILPFFIVPGEVNIAKEDKEQILSYESYTGKTIKFFSPEGTEKQTSGKILERLNLMLRNKQKEQPYTPDTFSRDEFLSRVADENKLILDTLVAEKKLIPGVYVHRQEIEIKLREWVGARASIFFIASEAGSGKTNLLMEMQKQYADWGLNSLLIRAGRMEKPQLAEQIAYLLNIDSTLGLRAYPSIAGTQSAPLFILIDGLNEAFHAERLWKEVLELSQLFEPGSLKFVVTIRANTAADLDRYAVNDDELNLVYGEKKEQQEGLAAFTFWLTALNMEEMKAAWDNYAVADKSRYKPLFSFEDIASFDRAIYDQINNPLVLRIFLEVYNRKSLPKKGKQHLNIWQDWLQTFSVDEQQFLELLASEIWNKGENELLLDELLKIETLKNYLLSDNLNSPYQRLKNLGWVSRYVKDVNVCIGFTVEGMLLYQFGVQLQQRTTAVDIEYIDEVLQRNNKLQKAGLESFLSETALKGELKLITELIDAGGKKQDICKRPLLHFMKSYGVEVTLDKLLENPTDNDWKAMLQLNKLLDELELHVLRKDFLGDIVNRLTFINQYDTRLGLESILVIDDEYARIHYNRINLSLDFISSDSSILNLLGNCERKFANYERALEFYEKSLKIKLEMLGDEHLDIVDLYNNIGLLWSKKGDYDKALHFCHKCLDICLKKLGEEHADVAVLYQNIGLLWSTKGNDNKAMEFCLKGLMIELKKFGEEHPDVADSYQNIGTLWSNKGDYDKALDFYLKCLRIQLKTFGEEHPDVATTYNNIGLIWDDKGEYDKALEFHEKSLLIRLNTLGCNHPVVAASYNNIGLIWNRKGFFDKSLEYYIKSIDIELNIHGEQHPSIAISYNNIGSLCHEKGDNEKAIEFSQKSLEIFFAVFGPDHPHLSFPFKNIGIAYRNKGDYDKALEYFQKSLEIRLKKFGIDDSRTKESISYVKEMYEKLGKENEIPDWMQDS